MKKIVLYALALTVMLSTTQAQEFRKHRVNIKALSTTAFELTDVDHKHPRIRDFRGQDFIVVSVREPGSDGAIYAVDKGGVIWWQGSIASGAGGGKLIDKNGKYIVEGGHETSNNIFKILAKRRFHMSKTHPSADGVNNMDFELQFTPDGQALHLGNVNGMSHGCIHVAKEDISSLFKWSKVGMPVIIMRGNYKQHLNTEVKSFQKDIEAYNKKH